MGTMSVVRIQVREERVTRRNRRNVRRHVHSETITVHDTTNRVIVPLIQEAIKEERIKSAVEQIATERRVSR